MLNVCETKNILYLYIIKQQLNKREMRTILKKETTKRYRALMNGAVKNSNRFLTGYPLSILKYGVYPDGNTSFITFETKGGIEETYKGDSLASAMADSEKIIEFKLNRAAH